MGKEGRPRSRRRHPSRSRSRKREYVLKHVYVLPNLITTAGLFCGVLALVRIFEGDPLQACWLILFASVLDAFDGMIARLTHTESEFGLNLDSLSDLVTFGVGPATLILVSLSGEGPKPMGVTTPCILYIICGALRLARFNVQAQGQESRTFTGLPIPAAGGALIAAYLVFRDAPQAQPWVLPTFILFLAVLMVSNVPYPSPKSFKLKHRKPFDYLVAAAVVAALLTGVESKELVLLGGFLIYIGWGLSRAAAVKLRRYRSRSVPPKPSKSEAAPAETGSPRGIE